MYCRCTFSVIDREREDVDNIRNVLYVTCTIT